MVDDRHLHFLARLMDRDWADRGSALVHAPRLPKGSDDDRRSVRCADRTAGEYCPIRGRRENTGMERSRSSLCRASFSLLTVGSRFTSRARDSTVHELAGNRSVILMMPPCAGSHTQA